MIKFDLWAFSFTLWNVSKVFYKQEPKNENQNSNLKLNTLYNQPLKSLSTCLSKSEAKRSPYFSRSHYEYIFKMTPVITDLLANVGFMMCSFRPLSDKDQINSMTLIDHQLFTHDHPPGCTHLHNSPFITNSKTHISTATQLIPDDTHWDSLASTDLHLSGLSPTRQSHRYAIKRDYLILVWVSPRKEPIIHITLLLNFYVVTEVHIVDIT